MIATFMQLMLMKVFPFQLMKDEKGKPVPFATITEKGTKKKQLLPVYILFFAGVEADLQLHQQVCRHLFQPYQHRMRPVVRC